MKVFPFRDTIRKAYYLTRSHLWLWVFGLVAGGMDFNYSADEVKKEQLDSLILWITNHPRETVPLVAAGLLLLFCLLYLFSMAKAGLIWAISKFANPSEAPAVVVNIRTSSREGHRFWKRVAGIHLLVWAAFIMLLAAYVLPVWYLYSLGAVSRAMVLVVVGFVIFIPAAVVFAFVNLYGSLFIVLYNMRVRESLNYAFNLLKSRFRDTILFGLLLILIEVFFVLALTFGIILLGIAFAVLGSLHGSFLLMSPIVIGAVALVFMSLFSVFQNAAWVMAFQHLVKDQKMSKAEARQIAEEAKAEAEPTTD